MFKEFNPTICSTITDLNEMSDEFLAQLRATGNEIESERTLRRYLDSSQVRHVRSFRHERRVRTARRSSPMETRWWSGARLNNSGAGHAAPGEIAGPHPRQRTPIERNDVGASHRKTHEHDQQTARLTMKKETEDEWIKRLRAEIAAQNAADLEQAKREAAERGKEPFDLDKFDKIYPPAPYLWHTPTRQQRLKRLEELYYVSHPEVMTLEEFAKLRAKLDIWE